MSGITAVKLSMCLEPSGRYPDGRKAAAERVAHALDIEPPASVR